MTPKKFDEVNVVMGEGQPEYKPLPAHRNPETGEVIMCFSLSEEEKARVQETGEIWVSLLTFKHPMQPIIVTTEKNELL